MRKDKKGNQNYPDHYEDILRLEKLDTYESQIKSNHFLQQNNKPIE